MSATPAVRAGRAEKGYQTVGGVRELLAGAFEDLLNERLELPLLPLALA